jgi:outer membrane receptor protein involved in Fe transport
MSGSIDRVEVLKGAQSSLYGSGALAGTIQVIFKKRSRRS